MKERTVERDICPECRAPATVTFERLRNGTGKVVAQAPYRVSCTNPRCENAPLSLRRA
jgi:hypothetical protein